MNISEITDRTDRRLEIAFETFCEGLTISFNGVVFQLKPNNTLQVNSYSEFSNPSQINSDMAKNGIELSKGVVSELCKTHPEYQPKIAGTEKEYYFCCDYHTGAVAVAKEVNGNYQ